MTASSMPHTCALAVTLPRKLATASDSLRTKAAAGTAQGVADGRKPEAPARESGARAGYNRGDVFLLQDGSHDQGVPRATRILPHAPRTQANVRPGRLVAGRRPGGETV